MNYTKHTLLFASAVVLGVVLGMATIALAQSITFDKDIDLQGTKKLLNAANVGIGTTAPGAKLDIGTAGTSLGTMRLAGNTSGYVQIQPSAAAGSYTLTLPTNDGDASQVLTTDGSGVLSWATAGGGAQTPWTSNINAAGYTLYGNNTSGGNLTLGSTSHATKGYIKLGTNSAYDETNARLGIGTTGPGAKLEIAGGTTVNALSVKVADTNTNFWNGYVEVEVVNTDTTVNNWGRIVFTDAVNGGWSGGLGLQYTDHTNNYGDLAFWTRGTSGLSEKVRIQSNGNVGIGTTGPSYTLDVKGPDTNNAVIARFYSSSSGRGAFIIRNGVGTSPTTYIGTHGGSEQLAIGTQNAEKVRIDGSGNVGIGTTTPSYKLDVAGTGQFTQPVLVGTPTASGHSATKSYVDSAIVSTQDMVVKGNCTGPVSIDWSQGKTQHCVLTGNVTFTFSNGQSGASYKVILKQDGTGSRTVTWPASVRWGSMGTPYLTPVPSKTDYVGFVYNGVDSKYDGVAFNANY